MTFEQSVRTCLNKYIDIEGRASRSEYWWFVLFNIIASVVANIIDSVLGLGIFGALLGLALLAPGITAGIRRLHDRNMSGWWMLLWITGVGALILLILFVLRGTEGPNRFGPDPVA